MRELVRVTLVSRGYNVLEAENGERGLQIAEILQRTHRYPDHRRRHARHRRPRTGQETAPLRPGISVLYLSGYTEDAVVTQGALGPAPGSCKSPSPCRISPRKSAKSFAPARQVLAKVHRKIAPRIDLRSCYEPARVMRNFSSVLRVLYCSRGSFGGAGTHPCPAGRTSSRVNNNRGEQC